MGNLLKQLDRELRWQMFLWNIMALDWNTMRTWIWVGHLGISFRRLPRFNTKLMIKKNAKKGIRVTQFGPLVMTWEETRSAA